MELLLKEGEKITMHIGGKKVIVTIVGVEDENESQPQNNLAGLSREELLKFLDTHTSDSLTGSITKFEEPFDSPIAESDWGFTDDN